MSAFAQQPSPASTGRTRLIALCATGALIIAAGALAPRLFTLPEINASSEDATPAPSADPASPDLRALIERGVVGLAVIAMIWAGSVWYLRRRQSPTIPVGPRMLNVAAALPLPHRCCVYLIEIGDQQFVTGVDANGIQAVVPLSDSSEQPPTEIEHTAPNRSPLKKLTIRSAV